MSAQIQKSVRRRKAKHEVHVPHGTDPEIVRMAANIAKQRAAERESMVATAAYYLAQRRGFELGHELEDWLAAEAEIADRQRISVTAASGEPVTRRMS